MNPFKCHIVAMDTEGQFEGRLTLQHNGERITLPILPLSLYIGVLEDWKPGDEVLCNVNENRSCSLSQPESYIDPVVLDDSDFGVLKSWTEK